MTRKRLTKEQQQAITRQMLEESRTLIEQGVPLREVAQRVAELRNDLVRAAREGVTLTSAESQETECVKVQRIETAEGIEYQIGTKAGKILSLSPEEAYEVLEGLYQWRESLYHDVREVVQEAQQETHVLLETLE